MTETALFDFGNRVKLISIGNVDVWMSYCDLAFDAFFRGRILDAISVIGRKLGRQIVEVA